ncbi:Cu(2+)-transporting P-type ATPase [Coemansia sp. RSA 451]|nr:Cu(2+)-transporting P-type ATPase [Coemansia sp. RSA 451]
MSVSGKQRWRVQGMTCQSCVRAIESALSDKDGIQAVCVSLEDNQATVTYALDTVTEHMVTEAIEDCGFDVQVEAGSLRHIAMLGVHGMTCQSCVRSITSVLNDTSGVTSVSVELEAEQATVEWNPELTDVHRVVEAITGCGFDVDEPSERSSAGPSIVTTVMLAQVRVDGMTCQSCVRSVTAALRATAGVLDAAVELEPQGWARVSYDPHQTDAKSVMEAIEAAGFDAALDSVTDVESDTALGSTSAIQSADFANTPDTMDGRAFGSDHTTQPLLDMQGARAHSGSGEAAYSFSSNKSGETLLDTEPLDATGSHISTQFEVRGMTCSSCVAAIERGLQDREGIHSVSVSLLAQRATVQHDSNVVSDTTIAQWIEGLGFEAKSLDAVSRVSKVSLNVYGMTCASCVGMVERSVRKERGVESVSVSLALETAVIEYRPSEIGVRKLVAVVESAGFDVLVADDAKNNTQLESLQRTRDILAWRRRFVQSLFFSIPVIFLAKIASHMAWSASIVHWQVVAGLPLGSLLQLLLTTPLQFVVGGRFYANAFKALRHGNANMDVLVTTGTSLAYFFSLFMLSWSVFHGNHPRPHCFFEAPAMLITFVSLGRYLENLAKGNASAALSTLMTLTPAQATLIIYDGGRVIDEKMIPTELIQVGDHLRVFPGERIPADGTLLEGGSQVDESTVTGEALPVRKSRGMQLVAGTVNGTGSFTMAASRVGADTTLAQIVQLVEEAQTAKAPIQAYADRVAQYFAPCVLLLALLTFLGWVLVSYSHLPKPAMFQAEADETGSYMVGCLKIAVAVVVVACPCALGLSTPTAVMVGTGVGAQMGVLIKGGDALEAASRIDVVVFDKTGTLTRGKLAVADMGLAQNAQLPQRVFVLLAGAAEQGSEHPLGKAIVAYAQATLDTPAALPALVTDFDSVPGKGVRCVVTPDVNEARGFGASVEVLVGSLEYLETQGVVVPAASISEKTQQERTGRTVVVVAVDGKFAGWMALSDVVRAEAIPTIATLQNTMGIECIMVTGDQPLTAQAVAAECGIQRVYAGVSPAGKAAIIAHLQSESTVVHSSLLSRLLCVGYLPSRRNRVALKRVAMVGDGVNDGAALAASNVGIALKSGTDVAMEAASMILMREDISDVVTALDLAQTIFRRIQWNYVWASIYNMLGIPLAMGVFIPIGVMMPPVFAGLAMAMSSLSVMASSLLLKMYRRPVCRAPSAASLPLAISEVRVVEAPRMRERREFVVDMSEAMEMEDMASETVRDAQKDGRKTRGTLGYFGVGTSSYDYRELPQ